MSDLYENRIIILIIIIISLGKILSSYIANTSRPHACTDVRTHALEAGETMADQRLIEINNARATLYSR